MRKRLWAVFVIAILCLIPGTDIPKSVEFLVRMDESYKLMEGTEQECEIVLIQGEEEGPCVFVVGGIHGDEPAGWMAANRLKNEVRITAGSLYILSPANARGVAKNERDVVEYEDLNRSFPGSANGFTAERLAHAIFTEIERIHPAVVMDLHEAYIKQEGRDFLGSSLIFTSLDGIDGLVMNALRETERGTLCSVPFGYYGPGPQGSINRTITEQLKIPVITVETYRDYELERRISDHLDILHYVLGYFKLEG